MKTFFLFLFFSLPVFGSYCNHDGKNFRCVKYLKNYDGDTVTFNIPDVHPLLGKKIPIRVAGVDTPELKTTNQCEKFKARIAKKLVQAELKHAKNINLTSCKRGKYFRLVCDIEYDGKNLKDILFKNALAYPYDGGTKKTVDWCY